MIFFMISMTCQTNSLQKEFPRQNFIFILFFFIIPRSRSAGQNRVPLLSRKDSECLNIVMQVILSNDTFNFVFKSKFNITSIIKTFC